MGEAIRGVKFSGPSSIKINTYNLKNNAVESTVKYTTQIYDANAISVESYEDVSSNVVYSEYSDDSDNQYGKGAVYYQKGITRLVREGLTYVADIETLPIWFRFTLIGVSTVSDIGGNVWGSTELSGKNFSSSAAVKQIVSDGLKTFDKLKVKNDNINLNLSPKAILTDKFAATGFKNFIQKDEILSNIFKDAKYSVNDLAKFISELDIDTSALKSTFGKFTFGAFGAEAAVNVAIAGVAELVPCFFEAIETGDWATAFSKYKWGTALYTGVATAAWAVGGKLLFSWMPAPAQKVVTKVWNAVGASIVKWACDQYSSETARAWAAGAVVAGAAVGIVLVCCISAIPVVGWAFGAAVLVGAAVGSAVVWLFDKFGWFT